MKKSKALNAFLNVLKVMRFVWFSAFSAFFAFLALVALCYVFRGEFIAIFGCIPAAIVSITMWDYRRVE